MAALRWAGRERGEPLPSIDVADAPLDERRELSEGATTGGRGFHKSRRIIDANPGLGGSFTIYWNHGPNPPGRRPIDAGIYLKRGTARLLGCHLGVLLTG